MRDLFLQTLTEIARADRRIFLITADLGFKVLDEYRKLLPDQFLNIGIAEQNMIGVATGMALSGRIVFVYSIANFPTLRCLEQIRNDACYHNANVNIVSVGAGLSYGQLGISHHATEDLAIMRAIPDLTVCSPGDIAEVRKCTEYLVKKEGAGFIRLDRACEEIESKYEDFNPVEPRMIKKGTEICLIVTGGMQSVAKEVALHLDSRNLSTTILSVPILYPLDTDKLVEIASSHEYVFTIEEHSIVGGLGGLISESILESSFPKPKFYRFGIRNGFTSIVGDQQFLRSQYMIDAPSIVEKISELLG